LVEAVDALNAAIRAHKNDPLSWYPGKIAATWPAEIAADLGEAEGVTG
jgi:hypothetical protein